jgi:hypothetical protein
LFICLPEGLMFVNSMGSAGLLHAGYDPIHEHIPRLVAEVQQTGFPEQRDKQTRTDNFPT